MQVWGIGEVLWDVFPDGEQFGGAALNFCANVQRLGDQATLLSAVASDERGTLALQRMMELGLSTRYIRVVDEPPTGVAIVSTSEDGEPSFHIPRPAAFDMVSLEASVLDGDELKQVDWLYFGTLLQIESRVEQFTTEIASSSSHLRCFYDMNLRTGQWNLPLVQRLSGLASILKLNEDEARTLFELTQADGRTFSLEEFCRTWASAYSIELICVTRGPDGCAVFDGKAIHQVAGFPIKVSDTVGAGDAFAAAFLHGYHRAWPIARTARFANALGAIVASRSGATPNWSVEECLQLAGISSE